MKIEINKVVSMHYTLTDDAGTKLDSSAGGEPLKFIYGNGTLISGLEKELAGKKQGEKFSCVIPPAEAYGDYDKSLIVDVPRSEFDTDAASIEVGMAFYANTEEGPRVVHVINVKDDVITLDGNHELAGKTLHFDIEIVEVRDATEEELHPPRSGCGGNCGGCSGCGSAGGCGGGCE